MCKTAAVVVVVVVVVVIVVVVVVVVVAVLVESDLCLLGIFGDICSKIIDGRQRRELSFILYIRHAIVMFLEHLCCWKVSIN
jgi:hypothetical protein